MRKRGLYFLAAAMLALAWSMLPVESGEAVALARVLYANCAQQTDETMRVFGSVIVNRVGLREYGDTLGQVLAGFESGTYFDGRALEIARALCEGKRSFDAAPAEVVHAVHVSEDHSGYEELGFWRMCGEYAFYYRT